MPTPDPATGTSVTLIDRLRANDQDAWSRLVGLYGPLVRFWAGRRGVVGADADDVVQEVFGVVTRKLDGFRRDRPGDTFRGWLYGVTRHALMHHARRDDRQLRGAGGTEAQQYMSGLAAGEADDEPDPPAERAALYHRGLELVRGQFEPNTWRAFWDHVVGGRAAADLGVSAATVRQAKSRVLRQLRAELGDLID